MKSKIEALKNIANILRRDVLQTTTKAGSGHPTSCLSCAELMSCLFFNELVLDIENFGKPKKSKFSKKDSENKFSDTFKIRDFEVFDEFPSENRGKSKSSIKNPDNPSNDEFILSKGHAAPILYSALYRAGSIKNNLSSLRKFNSPLEGHPLPSLPFIKYATGSLGQGLSIGVGMAIANKLDKKTSRVYVLLGDSELAEGSVYEAFELASYYRLNNLIAIADINRLGQRGETMFGHNVNEYEKRFKGFNWDTIKIDGHNISQILNAFKKARKSNNPTIILAKTLKGKGVSFIEDKNGWHGRALNKEELERALMEIPNAVFPSIKIKKPLKSSFKKSIYKKYTPNCYEIGKQIATREAYGNALSQLSLSNPRIIAVDAEVSNSTFSEKVKEKTPEQFVEAFIAEQNMIGMALGLSKRNFNVFASTFSAFLTRAHDQLRMAAYSDADITFCGSHAGVSIGEDGVSQMGLEDISMFRSLFNSTVLYPCDSVSTEKLVYECSKLKGDHFLEIERNLGGRFVERINYACIDEKNCDENLPVKDCSKDNVIVYREARDEEERIFQDENCVYIISLLSNQSKFADALLFNILGI